MLKLKLQYFGHLMQRIDFLEKTLMLRKIAGGGRRGQEDETAGWHHRLNGCEFEQALGVGEGQGSLVRCSPWGCKESDMTERLNWSEQVELDENWFSTKACDILTTKEIHYLEELAQIPSLYSKSAHTCVLSNQSSLLQSYHLLIFVHFNHSPLCHFSLVFSMIFNNPSLFIFFFFQ